MGSCGSRGSPTSSLSGARCVGDLSTGPARLTPVVRQVIELKQASESSGQILRESLIAVGTIGATAIAVYVGVIRDWRRRPKLSLEYGGPEVNDAVVVGVGQDPEDLDAAYVRLRVVAAKHRSAAEGAEVMIVSARELKPRQGRTPRTGGIALEGQLRTWSNTEQTITGLVIPPGIARHVDLTEPGGGAVLGRVGSREERTPHGR
jgi:hypothetical protein